MRYLITGAAGFLGTHLASRLLAEGHEVIGLDNFHSGAEANISRLRLDSRFQFVQHDVVTPYDIPCEVVCNLACPASPPHYQRDPIYTAKIAFLGTLHALENAERNKAKVLQASTSEIYGDPLVHPQPEDYLGNVNPIGVRSCYDEGKRIGETLCADFTRLGRVDARLVRIFNTYGPRMSATDGRVVSNLILQALQGQDLTVFGDGTQTRSFCYVDDTIHATRLLMASPKEVTGPINVGNPTECTILELASLILELTDSRSKLSFLPAAADDPHKRQPSIELARRELTWEPELELKEGLLKTIAYFDSYLK